jgi:predicted NBD/HSP70 family sugar kinase
MIAVDIGGSNFRCGLVNLNMDESPDLSAAKVERFKLWRHADDKPDRDEATENLGAMIGELIEYAKKKDWKVTPIIGVGCPGTVLEDGRLEGGTLNLPGDWGKKSFNLVTTIREMIPTIRGHATMVVLHNDAVVQGLSETPFMSDVEHWGVLTIGTGLGNACFRNKVE